MYHSFPFDPTYGYDLPRLLEVAAPEGPADFAAFWASTIAEARAIPPRVSSRETGGGNEAVRVFEVEFDSFGGTPGARAFRTGGWIVTPRTGLVTRGFVIGHGYGGREAPDLALPAPHAAAIFPCARGFNRSARPDLPDTAAWHVVRGIEHRDTYIHRACAAELWAAASGLLEFAPETAQCLDYFGVSFGGGMGALALPWDRRFRRAYLEVPSFGNHPLRVTLPCTGSGEAVRLHYQRHPEVLEVLAYFDAATAARHLAIPVLFCNALFDPSVPPPGQFAVHNAAPASTGKRLLVRQAGHFDYAGQAEEERGLLEARTQWFAAAEQGAERGA